MGGLFIGNMLARQGWQVDIFERVTSGLEARGAGIAGHAELTAVLRAIGATTDRPVGIDVSGRIAFDRFGNELARYDYPQYLTSWNLVFRLLQAAFPRERYHLGVEMRDLHQTGDGAVATLSNGETIAADLVVGADGIRSKVRGALAPEIEPNYGGYVAWRGVIEEADLSPAFMAETFGQYSFCFPPGGQLIGYPMSGQDGSVAPGSRRYCFVWYRHVAAGDELDDLLTDDVGRRHDHSIPPPLIRRTHIEALHRDGMRDLPPRFTEIFRKADGHLLQPIYDLQSRHIAFGRVALLGDAAFVCRPHVGVGVLKAAQDAAALAQCLDQCDAVPEALARYEEARLQDGVDAVAFGRQLGAFIERGLADPTVDPELGLSYDFIVRESARLPRTEAMRRNAVRERVLQ